MEPQTDNLPPVETVTDLRKGQRVVLVYGYQDRFWLRERKDYIKSGEIITIASLVLKKMYPQMLSSITGKAVVNIAVGFEECCEECRTGKPHHEVTGAHHMFGIVEDKDSPTTRTKESDGGWVPAKKIADIVIAMSRPWNPTGDLNKCRIHVGNFEYEIRKPYNETEQVIAISLAYAEHGESYFRFKIRGETSEDHDQRIPIALARPIVTLYDTTRKHIEDIVSKIQEFEIIMKELEDAKQTS